MLEEIPTPTPGANDLILKAMLYASGELDADEAAAFELRLGEDQAARDALCQAVELTQSLTPEEPAGPDPAYRSQVRQRLRQRRRQRLSLSHSAPSFFGHPAFWSIAGAAAAILLIVLISQLIAHLEEQKPRGPNVTQPQTPPGTPSSAAPHPAAVANAWADLNNTDRLQQVQSETSRLRFSTRPPSALSRETPP